MTVPAMLLGLAWKSAAIAGLTLILLRLARLRSASERSLIAHVGLAALLALPAAMLLLPTWMPLPETLNMSPEVAPAATGPVADGLVAESPVSAAVDASSFVLPAVGDLAPFLYAIPLALLSGVMLLAIVRLFAMRGRAEVLVERSWLSALAEAQRRMGFKHGTALLVSEELRSPISWGVLRPTIVLNPAAVTAVGEAEAIIAHELAHVARLDWAKLLAARLVWILARESHQLREEAADDAVLLADIDGPDYATLLVGAARHDNQGALLAAHGVAPGTGSLKRRITRVLDGSLRRAPASARWFAMNILLATGLTAPLAAFSVTAEPAPADEALLPVAAVGAPRPFAGAREVRAAEEPHAETAQKPLTAEQLVSMRAVGVTPEYVAGMREHGASMDPEDIIAAKATGVDPAYVRAMRGVFPNAGMDDLIGASALHIEPGYAREMKSQFPAMSVDDLAALRAMDITGDYIRGMRGAGYTVQSPDEAIELRATGMTHRAKRDAAGRRGSRASAEIGRGVVEARADRAVARIEYSPAPEPPASLRP